MKSRELSELSAVLGNHRAIRMRTRVAVDPSLLSSEYVTNPDNPPYLGKLSRYKDSFVNDKEIVSLYDDYFEKLHEANSAKAPVEIEYAALIVKQITSSTSKFSNENTEFSDIRLPNEVEQLISKLNDTHRRLVTAVCKINDAVVIVPDQSIGSASEISDDIRSQLAVLFGRDIILSASEFSRPSVQLVTEGKSDWKHLKAALHHFRRAGRFIGLQLSFCEYEESMGDRKLLKKCSSPSESDDPTDEYPKSVTICIFDRDNPDITKEVSDISNNPKYKRWRRDLFSFALPIPQHRSNTMEEHSLCIEFYYQDDEIKLEDEEGRRLYLSSEFDSQGWIVSEGVQCKVDRYKSKNPIIIDDKVIRSSDSRNVALPKNNFASYVMSQTPPFNQIQLTPLVAILEIVKIIVNDNFS